MEKAEWEAFQDQIEEGDWIVLASDGVFEGKEETEAIERRIRTVMLRETESNSQIMAQRIYEAVCSGWTKPEDDLTIIAVKIEKNRN